MVSQVRDASLDAAVLQHGTTSRRQTSTTRQEKKPSTATDCAPIKETEGNTTWICRRLGKSFRRCALLAGSLHTGTLGFRWSRLSVRKGKMRNFDAFIHPGEWGWRAAVGLAWPGPRWRRLGPLQPAFLHLNMAGLTVKPLPFLSIHFSHD